MKNHQEMESIIDDISKIQGQPIHVDQQPLTHILQKDHQHQSPAIKILSIFGGLFAGLAFFGFIALTGLLTSHSGMVIFGVISLMTAIIVNRIFDSIILDTLSVTFYIAAYILLTFGLLEMYINTQTVSLIILGTALLSLLVIRNYLLSFVSVLIINFSILSLFFDHQNFQLISWYTPVLVILLTYFVLYEAKLITSFRNWMHLYFPLRIGLIVSLLSVLILYSRASFFEMHAQYIWPSSIIMILSLMFILSKILKVLSIDEYKQQALVYFLGLCVLLPLIVSPAILGTLVILLLSFYVNHKTGFGIGILSLIFFITQYYYDLNLDLLSKSILLMLSGLLLIALYFWASKKLGAT